MFSVHACLAWGVAGGMGLAMAGRALTWKQQWRLRRLVAARSIQQARVERSDEGWRLQVMLEDRPAKIVAHGHRAVQESVKILRQAKIPVEWTQAQLR